MASRDCERPTCSSLRPAWALSPILNSNSKKKRAEPPPARRNHFQHRHSLFLIHQCEEQDCPQQPFYAALGNKRSWYCCRPRIDRKRGDSYRTRCKRMMQGNKEHNDWRTLRFLSRHVSHRGTPRCAGVGSGVYLQTLSGTQVH